MNRLKCFLRCSLFLLAFLRCVPAAQAQQHELDRLAAEIAKEVKVQHPRLVAVADFRPPYGSDTTQGHYFAWMLSTFLKEHASKSFVVASHPNFDADLARLHLNVEALAPGDALRSLAPEIGAEVLITGSFEKRGNDYFLHVTPIRVGDGKALETHAVTMESNEFFESMITPLPADVPLLEGKASGSGISMPSCAYCPNPSYTDPARRAKINGASLFEVVISPTGQATQIHPRKLLGYGLDEQAYYTLKKWQFRPARRLEDNEPVTVAVPVEVTFRLY